MKKERVQARTLGKDKKKIKRRDIGVETEREIVEKRDVEVATEEEKTEKEEMAIMTEEIEKEIVEEKKEIELRE